MSGVALMGDIDRERAALMGDIARERVAIMGEIDRQRELTFRDLTVQRVALEATLTSERKAVMQRLTEERVAAFQSADHLAERSIDRLGSVLRRIAWEIALAALLVVAAVLGCALILIHRRRSAGSPARSPGRRGDERAARRRGWTRIHRGHPASTQNPN